jgi:ribA/ribD-fused uncharacterized protein
MIIASFNGKYRFLSNFYNSDITFKNITYKNAEAAFHAQKIFGEGRKEFADLNPSDAKRLGRRVLLRKDWEEVKDGIMYEIVQAKFEQNPVLAKRLLDTGDAELIEGNTWNDRYWGVCAGIGQNKLGKILMRVRDNLKA